VAVSNDVSEEAVMRKHSSGLLLISPASGGPVSLVRSLKRPPVIRQQLGEAAGPVGWTCVRAQRAPILSYVTPTGFEKVNFDGVLAVSLEQHRARILPSSSPPEVPHRAVR
jgi:hypothetical protein